MFFTEEKEKQLSSVLLSLKQSEDAYAGMTLLDRPADPGMQIE